MTQPSASSGRARPWYEGDDDAGLSWTLSLINTLTPAPTQRPYEALAEVLAIDPSSARVLRRTSLDGFQALAIRLRDIAERLARGEVDGAARRINAMLTEHPAVPHLAKEGGRWRLHHHPVDAELVAMWSAIGAHALARLIEQDSHDRVGVCEADGCERVFLDGSKNGTRRFCSTTCQNRMKAAAFRRRAR